MIFWQNSVSAAKVYDHVSTLKALNNTADYFTLTILKHIKNNFSLSIFHPVNNDLLCRLSSDSSQVGDVLHFFAKLISKLDLRVKDLGLLQTYFCLFVLRVLNDTAELEHFNLAKLLIITDFYVPPAAEFLSCRRSNCFFNSFHKKIFVKPAIPANLIDDTF